MTPQRRAVLDAIEASDGRFTAVELFERARASSPRLGLATTYRTLELLRRTGSAARALRRGTPAYVRCSARAPPPPRLPQLRLRRGHRAVRDPAQRTLTRRHGFRAESHELEIYGTCRTACELDRDPARRADRPLDARRRARRAAPAPRADDADRAHGGIVVGVALFDVLPEAIDAVGDAAPRRRRSSALGFLDLLPRRARTRPPPPRRARAGSRARAGRRAGRGGALAAQLHRRARDRPRVRRRHDDRACSCSSPSSRTTSRTA